LIHYWKAVAGDGSDPGAPIACVAVVVAAFDYTVNFYINLRLSNVQCVAKASSIPLSL